MQDPKQMAGFSLVSGLLSSSLAQILALLSKNELNCGFPAGGDCIEFYFYVPSAWHLLSTH